MSAVTRLLDRLQRVRRTGDSTWLTACPAHEDRSPSLSIRDVEGRVLVHCFAGCEVGDVVAAVGLTLGDLYEKRLPDHRYRAAHSRIPARDLLAIISAEVTAVAIIANEVLERRLLAPDDWQRLAEAVAKIGAARDHSHGR